MFHKNNYCEKMTNIAQMEVVCHLGYMIPSLQDIKPTFTN